MHNYFDKNNYAYRNLQDLPAEQFPILIGNLIVQTQKSGHILEEFREKMRENVNFLENVHAKLFWTKDLSLEIAGPPAGTIFPFSIVTSN